MLYALFGCVWSRIAVCIVWLCGAAKVVVVSSRHKYTINHINVIHRSSYPHISVAAPMFKVTYLKPTTGGKY